MRAEAATCAFVRDPSSFGTAARAINARRKRRRQSFVAAAQANEDAGGAAGAVATGRHAPSIFPAGRADN